MALDHLRIGGDILKLAFGIIFGGMCLRWRSRSAWVRRILLAGPGNARTEEDRQESKSRFIICKGSWSAGEAISERSAASWLLFEQ